MKLLPIFLIIIFVSFSPSFIIARVTPEDIVNSQRESYENKVKNYSSENQNKLEDLTLKIAQINKKYTGELEKSAITQGLILDEYIRRINYQEDGGSDGIHRNLSKEVENTRYWITYAHEAAAFQAAKVYIPSLSSESNIESDSLNLVNHLQTDLNATRAKVIKSQNLLKQLLEAYE